MSMVTFKHYCRICNKGFSCGPALGGHMRAHGIVNVNEDYADRVDHPAKRTMYGLRSNSNRVCDNCGRDFPTMESFINHGKCDSDDEEQELFVEERWLLFSSPKRFKSSSSNLIRSTEDEDLAKCLMLLSSSSKTVDSREESCESASKSKSPAYSPVPILKAYSNSINNVSNNNSLIFECKACKKVFSSHQALGGHRASHKKVKGCFASKLDQVEEEEEEEVEEVEEEAAPINESTSNLVIQGVEAELEKNKTKKKKKKKAKVHECSICQRQFGSGQALGGHKRCHWITSNLNSNPNPTHSAMPRVIRSNNEDELTLRLDLNVAVATSSSINYGGDHGKMVDMTTNGRGCNLSGVVEGEVEGMVKLAKLSELKDVINGGGGGGDVAPWLQVGIGSTGFERSM